MTALLDVNVLIALLDRLHVRHHSALHWFQHDGMRDWASCPIRKTAF